MYEVWGRNKRTMRYEYLWSFDDERQKYFMLDQVDKSIYYEVMILENKELKMYYENKEYKPYFKTLTKSKKD